MLSMRKLSLVLLAVSVLSPVAQAEDKKSKKTNASGEVKAEESVNAAAEGQGEEYKLRYGMAGCGFWSSVITSKDRGPQLGVWALRWLPYVGLIDSQMFGITSGTSNCVDARQYEEAEQLTFVTVNLASLSKEAAQGSGLHLESFAQILGCPYSEFAQLSQERYGEIFSVEKPDDVLAQYLREVRAHSTLAAACHRVG